MKKIVSLFLITTLLMVSMLSAVTANAQVLKTTEVLLFEDFEPPVGFTGEFSTDAYKYYSMFSAADIAVGNKVGYKGWQLTASTSDEENSAPSIYHVGQRADVPNDKIPTTYLDLRRYNNDMSSLPSIYYNLGVQSKNELIVRFTIDLLYSDSNGFKFSAKYFADPLTLTSWKPMNGTEITFTDDEKALFKVNEWNKIEFLADYTKNQVTLFVNGVQIREPQTVNQTADFKEVRLWGNNESKYTYKNLYVDNVKLEKVTYVDEDYIANGVTYTDNNGSVVSTPTNGNKIKNIRVEKDSAQNGVCTVIIARYNSTDKLVSAKTAVPSFTSDRALIDTNVEYANGDYVKVFILDGLNNIKPLTTVATFLK